MWEILESQKGAKQFPGLPVQVLKKYEVWKSIVRYNGPQKLREFKGFHDEALKGRLQGKRSSRLNIQYRLIYRVAEREQRIYVEGITPHNY